MSMNTTTESKWTPVSQALPDEGAKIEWIAPSGDVVKGTKGPGGIWFLMDGFYVYYRPVMWRLRKD